MLEASWRTAAAVVVQKTRQADPQGFRIGLLNSACFAALSGVWSGNGAPHL